MQRLLAQGWVLALALHTGMEEAAASRVQHLRAHQVGPAILAAEMAGADRAVQVAAVAVLLPPDTMQWVNPLGRQHGPSVSRMAAVTF